MGAWNDLLIEQQCPACKSHATIRCQMHLGASYDGDDRGRFAMREYRLGEPLWWWPAGHRHFESWHEFVSRMSADGLAEECTYANCELCGAELYVAVRFRDLTPVEILFVTEERPDWCG